MVMVMEYGARDTGHGTWSMGCKCRARDLGQDQKRGTGEVGELWC